ncbi:hypothetical protein C8Q80DRAFT_1275768 [Daedaleopsis nitida]|nr:hypothetical protein C8Q80DRAFT_1275768 [Daedaleopsis nitida]
MLVLPSLAPPLCGCIEPSLLRDKRPSRPWSRDFEDKVSALEDTSAFPFPPKLRDYPGRTTSVRAMEDEDDDLSCFLHDIVEYDMFGWEPDPTFKCIPLVDLWLDIAEHITADAISSPLDP